MRKVICLVLALVFCMALAMPAFATASVKSPGSTKEQCTGACTYDKEKGDGICTVCGFECDHEKHNEKGICEECGKKVGHEYKNGKCTVCGEKKASSSNTPDTGDMIMKWVLAMAAAVAALGAAVVVYRKKFA